jgi:hypothetical protein
MTCFGLCSIRLSWSHYLGHGFGQLTQMVFCVFFNWFFLFSPLTLSWLEIEPHNLFLFPFYEVILVSWSKFGRLIQVDLTYFLVEFYFQFHHSTLDWLRVRFNIFFLFFSIVLSWSHDLGSEFNEST